MKKLNLAMTCRWLVGTLWVAGIVVAVIEIFSFRPLGYTIPESSYLYLVLGLFVSPVFVIFPAGKNDDHGSIPWYDYCLFVVSMGCFCFFALNGQKALLEGWEWQAPPQVMGLSAVVVLLVLEAVRRSSGTSLFLFCVLFLFYPVFASDMPGLFKGYSFSLPRALNYFVVSREGIVGIATYIVAMLVMGYMLFSTALMASGGGRFFTNLSIALVGKSWGGPAKVAILASSLFGSMSGSPVANVLTTGSFTIPAMKKAGYPPFFAAAVESVASTGGSLMPPIMGATAFLMASFLGIPYLSVIAVAAIPATLYYVALYTQVDAFAVKKRLAIVAADERTSLWQAVKDGSNVVGGFSVLLLVLIWFEREALAPMYGTAAIVVLTMLKARKGRTLEFLTQFVNTTGRIMGMLFAMMAGIGFIMGALSMTGVGHSIALEIVDFAGGNKVLIIALGAIASYILGCGMTTTAVYVFLAITLAPALVSSGFHALASHLFILYCAELSCLTPPVAIAAYTAAGLADASPVKTGFKAMQLGIAAYIVPFFFLLNAEWVLKGWTIGLLYFFLTCSAGLFLLGAALSAYLRGVGNVPGPIRVTLFISGLLLANPEILTSILGGLLAVTSIGVIYIQKKGRNLSNNGPKSLPGVK